MVYMNAMRLAVRLLAGGSLLVTTTSTTARERQVTHDTEMNHELDNNNNFSPDDRYLVFDTRAEGSIVDDLVTPAAEATRMKAQRSALRQMLNALEGVSPGVRRVLGEETGIDFAELIREGHQVLA